jgi:hypothetical protein
MVRVPNADPTRVFSFVRRNERDKVFAAFNLSPEPVRTTFRESLFCGTYTDFTTGERVDLAEDLALAMAPWSYRVFVV